LNTNSISIISVNNCTVVSGRPFGCCIILTESIEFPDSFASNIPLSIFSPVSEFTIITDGASVYPLPPSVTVIIPIVFEFLIVISGDIDAVGCKVLSEEYSNPSLIILTSFALPIDVDFGVI
jgi:hypothetical protein